MPEEYLVEHLPCISSIETFGCELTLLSADTQVALQDPVQEELWNTNHCLVVTSAFRCLENNKPLQGLDYEDCEEIPCRDVHLARCLQFAMHKFRLSLFVKDLEPGGSTTFCFLIV